LSTEIVELPQADGVAVNEKIIRFFERGLSRADAEMLYNHAVYIGSQDGNEGFDLAVQLVCDELGLDSNELIEQIHGTQLS